MKDRGLAAPLPARDRAAAALALALALGVAALPEPPSAPLRCAHPREHEALGTITAVVACGSTFEAGARLRGPARLLFGLRLDLNQASAATLEVLPGIGPHRAAAIVDARGERAFARVADLRRVSGIGPKTIAGLEALVQVEAGSADR